MLRQRCATSGPGAGPRRPRRPARAATRSSWPGRLNRGRIARVDTEPNISAAPGVLGLHCRHAPPPRVPHRVVGENVRAGRPLAANILANDAVRDAWRRRVTAMEAENARRRTDVRLRVHAGDPAAIEAAGP